MFDQKLSSFFVIYIKTHPKKTEKSTCLLLVLIEFGKVISYFSFSDFCKIVKDNVYEMDEANISNITIYISNVAIRVE